VTAADGVSFEKKRKEKKRKEGGFAVHPSLYMSM
jgi:hypothetical protein